MQKSVFTVAFLGVGARGGASYGQIIHKSKDKFKIGAICDLRQERLERFGDLFDVEKEKTYIDEDCFFAEKRADVLIKNL